MARLSIFNDTVAQLCYDYLHGTLDETTNEKIYEAVHSVVDQKDAGAYVYEITYHIGYVNSQLADVISEVTYKKRKKQIRDKLALINGLQENNI